MAAVVVLQMSKFGVKEELYVINVKVCHRNVEICLKLKLTHLVQFKVYVNNNI